MGTATVAFVNLSRLDPWVVEFVWKVMKESLSFCLLPTDGGGFPVISSLEVRPLPDGAYGTNLDEFANKLLKKRFRINCGYSGNGSLRYPLDYYDRVWDVDQNFSPSHLTAGFQIPIPLNFSGIRESPPASILQTARILARRNVLSYNFPLDKLGDYYVLLYFAGIMPVSSSFDVLINDNVVSPDYSVKHAEAGSIFFSAESVDYLNITFRNVSFYPQVNAIEIYEILDIPLECTGTTVSALQVIQQSTGFNFGWEDDPCSPTQWKHVGCDGSLVTSLNLSFNKLTSFGSDFDTLINLQIL
ncbi:putative LRR receptor-like serine/threonine-protein kinase [Cocos nucifera]|uniref:Putative LRR receptor-like serine/threonine-protein kinase n=1 Tax=Cocos nucifera TaxID=13894 RepID=A0A8K0IX70_COCNU|nr:putative LRR receptor-like serine/threonine-protein kinase [Cocos nucifera]